MASVGIVVVSHSSKIAEGTVELARQMAPTTTLVAAGGTDVVLTFRSGEEQAAAVVAEVGALGRRAVALQLDTTEPASFAGFVATLAETVRTTRLSPAASAKGAVAGRVTGAALIAARSASCPACAVSRLA